jgi:opacity protein-like surface antigen
VAYVDDDRGCSMMRILSLGMVFLVVAGNAARAIEPGARITVSGGILEMLGETGDDFTLGVGGSLGLGYRLQESFVFGIRWIARYQHGVAGSVEDTYDGAYFQGFLLESALVFNTDERTRPIALVGIGLTWLGWDYKGLHQPNPDEPDFLISDDKRRATTFLLGIGAEIDVGERWELIPTVQLLLNSWSDHTHQGVTITDDNGVIQAPTDAGITVEVGIGRRL